VLPALPSNEKNSFDHHNSYNEGLDLACNGLLESPLNFPSTKKVSKIQFTNWNSGCVPKIPKFHIWNSRSFRGEKLPPTFLLISANNGTSKKKPLFTNFFEFPRDALCKETLQIKAYLQMPLLIVLAMHMAPHCLGC
jgi:hypothetical protein